MKILQTLVTTRAISVLAIGCVTSLFSVYGYSASLESCARFEDDEYTLKQLGCPEDIIYSRQLLCKVKLTDNERQALGEATFPKGSQSELHRPLQFQKKSPQNHEGVVHYLWLKLTAPDEENNFQKAIFERQWSEPTTDFITGHRDFFNWKNDKPLSEAEFTETIARYMPLDGEWYTSVTTDLETYTVELPPVCLSSVCERKLVISRENLEAIVKTVGVEKKYDCELSQSSFEEAAEEALARVQVKIKESLAKKPIEKNAKNKI